MISYVLSKCCSGYFYKIKSFFEVENIGFHQQQATCYMLLQGAFSYYRSYTFDQNQKYIDAALTVLRQAYLSGDRNYPELKLSIQHLDEWLYRYGGILKAMDHPLFMHLTDEEVAPDNLSTEMKVSLKKHPDLVRNLVSQYMYVEGFLAILEGRFSDGIISLFCGLFSPDSLLEETPVTWRGTFCLRRICKDIVAYEESGFPDLGAV